MLLTVSVPREMLDELRERAAEAERSVSAEARLAIRRHLEGQEREAA